MISFLNDIERECVNNPALWEMLDEETKERLRRATFFEQNRRFLDLIGPDTRNDYMSFIRMTEVVYCEGYSLNDSVWRTVDVTDPVRVARYCASKNRGLWSAKEFNQRRRYSDGRVYPLKANDITEEDIATMMQHVTLAARMHPRASEARAKFAEATRSAAFTISLGIREIRLVGRNKWDDASWLQPSDVAALQRLVDKGLLIHEQGEAPRLSEAGELIRQLAVLSNHIVEHNDGNAT